MAPPSARLRFGDATLDADRGVLRRDGGGEVPLRPKTLELLRLLLRQPGRLVTRAEILDAVWPEVTVTDDSITQCVVEIRRALGPLAALLKTVPRRGYLLELPAGTTTAPAAGPEPATGPLAGSGPAGVPVVAVLPFRQFPADDQLGFFAEGVLEGLVGALAALREPVVISANSTRHLVRMEADIPAIARRLGAQYVAAGSVRRRGGRIRLVVELAEAASSAVLWHRSYDLVDDEMFETQDRIAAVIAGTLVPRVQEAEMRRCARQPPADLSAYHLLLQARRLVFRMERPALEAAGELLRQAIARDPDFPPTHAALADWHSLRIGQGWAPDPPAETRALQAAAQAALELDGRNARALALLGHNQAALQRRYGEAVELFDRALDAAPNDAESWMWSSPTYAFLGEAGEAVRRAERAIQLSPEDPLLFRYEHILSIAHYAAGDHEEAVRWGQRSMRGNPHYTSNLRMTAASLAALGRVEEARPLAKRVMELQPGFRVAPMIARQAFRDDATRRQYGSLLVTAGFPE